jgi:hypothetical protein
LCFASVVLKSNQIQKANYAITTEAGAAAIHAGIAFGICATIGARIEGAGEAFARLVGRAFFPFPSPTSTH